MELRNFGLSIQKFPVRNGTAFSNNVDCIRQNAKSQFMADSQYLETFLGIFHTILSHSIISIWGGGGIGGDGKGPWTTYVGKFIPFVYIFPVYKFSYQGESNNWKTEICIYMCGTACVLISGLEDLKALIGKHDLN